MKPAVLSFSMNKLFIRYKEKTETVFCSCVPSINTVPCPAWNLMIIQRFYHHVLMIHYNNGVNVMILVCVRVESSGARYRLVCLLLGISLLRK